MQYQDIINKINESDLFYVLNDGYGADDNYVEIVTFDKGDKEEKTKLDYEDFIKFPTNMICNEENRRRIEREIETCVVWKDDYIFKNKKSPIHDSTAISPHYDRNTSLQLEELVGQQLVDVQIVHYGFSPTGLRLTTDRDIYYCWVYTSQPVASIEEMDRNIFNSTILEVYYDKAFMRIRTDKGMLVVRLDDCYYGEGGDCYNSGLTLDDFRMYKRGKN